MATTPSRRWALLIAWTCEHGHREVCGGDLVGGLLNDLIIELGSNNAVDVEHDATIDATIDQLDWSCKDKDMWYHRHSGSPQNRLTLVSTGLMPQPKGASL